MKPPALATASSEAVPPSAAVLGACFKNRPVRGPGLQWGQNRRVSCRPRALTRHFRGFSKHALRPAQAIKPPAAHSCHIQVIITRRDIGSLAGGGPVGGRKSVGGF